MRKLIFICLLGGTLASCGISGQSKSSEPQIRGRVYWDNLKGQPPAPGLAVTLYRDQKEVANVKTDAKGIYSFSDPSDGTYQITVDIDCTKDKQPCMPRAGQLGDTFRGQVVHKAGAVSENDFPLTCKSAG